MSFKNESGTPDINRVLIIGILLFFLTTIILVGGVVIYKTWNRAQLNSICPDYFSELYAYVVDQSGNGLDSVSVVLKDNSNLNVLYRTFTDKTGKFLLFNDFTSFALHDIPFSFELQVALNECKDTIKYKFQRYRTCHFKKVSGPDTIILNTDKNVNRVETEYSKVVDVDEVFEYAPFLKVNLTEVMPHGLTKRLENWAHVKYSTLVIGSQRMILAVARSSLAGNDDAALNGACYVIDRNGNGDLNDDPVKKWELLFSNSTDDIADCSVRKCFLRDTLSINGKTVVLDLQLSGLNSAVSYLSYRRGDALKAIFPVEDKRYRIALWDRAFSYYSDLKNVQIGIDVNDDGRFSSAVGDMELLETAKYGINLNGTHYAFDSIFHDGSVILYKKSSGDQKQPVASIGAWAPDFKAFYAQPISLYSELAENSLTLLCFFEGNSRLFMESVSISSFIQTLAARIPRIGVIGVNRKSAGDHYSEYPIIEENRGWEGQLVRKFHNHLHNEIICIDSSATIISRGASDRELLQSILHKLRIQDSSAVIAIYNRAIADASVIGTASGE